jgi:hypothetical protein
VAELAYTHAIAPVIWGRDVLGAWFGVTYKRDSLSSSQPPTYAAWHTHTLGSGRIVESLCAGPSTGGDLDALTMVTSDGLIRHVEVLTDTSDEKQALGDCWFLDDAVVPTSTASTAVGGSYGYGQLTINGLWHLNGATVQVFCGGLDAGDPGEGKAYSDFTVANGSVTIPYGDSISAGPGAGLLTAAFVATNPNIVVGFTYNSDAQLVRQILQAETGARLGPALGLLRRVHRYAMLLNNTLGLSIGTSFSRLDEVDGSNPDGTTLAPFTMFSGIAQNPMEDFNSFDSQVCWRVSRPFPANVVAVSVNLASQDQ